MKSNLPAFELNPRNYYRLPWSMTDNGISWLEVTASCNLACKGCYRPKVGGHKTLEQIAEDLAVFKKERKSDCMSIAGGDPLVHPEIVKIVRMVSEGGWKPIINTNGLGLTVKLLRDLKKAGAFGFTFHIDTSQERRDSRVSTEVEHNQLRQKFAEMLHAEGGLACSFNQTVTTETLSEIPSVVRWAMQHPDIVNTMVFILYREPRLFGKFDYFVKGTPVKMVDAYEQVEDWAGTKPLKAADVVAKIREADPLYEPSAYLNGTEDPNSMKWLIATRIANGAETYGYVSPRFMQWVQTGNRMIHGKWLSYSAPSFLKIGRSVLVGLAAVDPQMRKALGRYFKKTAKNPLASIKRAHLQTFTVIQPIDILADGSMSMCDGCPDMTVHEGKMYWSCRLEEIKKYGCFVTAAPAQTTSPN